MAARRRAKGDGEVAWDATRNRFVGRLPSTVELAIGLPKSVSAVTRGVCAQQLQKLREQHADALAAATEKKYAPVTITELIGRFSGTSDKPSKTIMLKSPAHDEWVFNKITQVLGDRYVNELRVTDIDVALADLCASGVKARKSLSRIRAVLRQLFDFAIDRDLCERNPATRAVLPKGAQAAREGVAMTADQCTRMLAELEENPFYAVWVTQLFQALRSGESAGLTIPDADFDEGLLHVRRAMIYDDGGKPVRLGPVKTGSRGRGRRTLRMAPEVAAALKARIEIRKMQQAVYGDQWPEQWKDVIFVSDRGVPPNSATLSNPFRLAGKRIGIQVRRYDARHTAATLLLDQGRSLEDVADILGHEDTRMARSVYTHIQGPRVLDGIVDLSSPDASL